MVKLPNVRPDRVSGSTSSASDICSPEGKWICDTSFSNSDTNYTFVGVNEQVLQTTVMGEKIASQLQEILNRLMSVETRLQKIEGFCEKISNLEKAVSKTQTELNSLHEKAIVTNKKVGEVEKGMGFANAEIEKRKKKEEEIAAEMKELKDGFLYQEAYSRRENLCFFGIPEDENGDENTRELLYKFFSDELNIENSDSIDFQRVHRLGRKKTGQPRPIIARFLRFPDREMVFKSVRELGEDTDVKVYPDYLDEIRERRRKQWPRMKKAREEGKRAYFSKAQPDKLYIDGDLVVFRFLIIRHFVVKLKFCCLW